MKTRIVDLVHRMPPRRRVLGVLGIAAAAVCLVALWLLQRDSADEAVKADENTQQVVDATKPAVDPVLRACARGNQLAADLKAIGACEAALNAADAIKDAEDDTTTPSSTTASDAVTEQDVEVVVARVLARSPLLTQSQVTGIVADYLARNPPADGKDGRDGPTTAQVRAIVADVYAANPPPAGQDGADGATGKPGTDGKPGRGISTATINDAGHLIISFTDDTTVDLGLVVGPAGQDGAPGAKGDPGQIPPQSYDCPAGYYQSGGEVDSAGVITPHCTELPAPGLLG